MGLGVTWLDAPLGLTCLLVGFGQLWLAVTRRAPAVPAAAHGAMGLGMAAMFVPAADPVPQPVWVVVFLVSGSWFGAAALREGGLLGTAGPHVVGAAAMLFMLLGGHDHGATAAGGPVDPEHAHHAAGGGAAPGLLVTVVALVLAAWFIADLVRLATRRSDPRSAVPVGAAPVQVATRVDLHHVGHVVMSVAMLAMLVGMV